ncbi:hypothetical protein ACLKA7_001120 [Drosophila subpalustris]
MTSNDVHYGPDTREFRNAGQAEVSEDILAPDVEIDTDDEVNNVPAEDGLFINASDEEDLSSFRCIVCKTFPVFGGVFKCPERHLFCAGCYQMRVLDKMLGAQLGTCPRCGMRIYRHQPHRHVVGESILSTVIVGCEKCEMLMPRGQLRHHGRNECPKRLITCKYKRIGCKWKGPIGLLEEAHVENCEYRHKTGLELFEELRMIQEKRDAKQIQLVNIMKLLQLPHITVRLLHLLPQSETFPRNQFNAGPSFQAFGQHWCVKFKWQTPDNSELPLDQQTDHCSLLFQLCLESSDSLQQRGPLVLTFTLISSVYSHVRFQPNLCEKCDFTRDNTDGPPTLLYENSWRSLDMLINKRGFYTRLLMSRI